mgnify:FL=1
MIKRIGTDFLEKSRIESIFLKYGEKFTKKILSNKEMLEFNSKKTLSKRVAYLSNNFASKEAVSKVLGTGFSTGVTIKDIEILRSKSGAPYVTIKGPADQIADKEGLENFHVTITDTKDYSLAFAIGETR